MGFMTSSSNLLIAKFLQIVGKDSFSKKGNQETLQCNVS